MFRCIRRTCAVLVLIGAALVVGVADTEPAVAANTDQFANCGSNSSVLNIGNSDTVTFFVGSNCSHVILENSGPGSAILLNGDVTIDANSPVAVVQGDSVIFMAPASGSGQNEITFFSDSSSVSFIISFSGAPSRADAVVDNGDGSITVMFDPIGDSESVTVGFYPLGTSCLLSDVGIGRLFFASTDGPNPISSPVIISAGSAVYTAPGDPPSTGPLVAGTYQTCVSFRSGDAPPLVEHSLVVAIGVVTPAFTG